MSKNERVFQLDAFAKYLVAFSRMSRSIFDVCQLSSQSADVSWGEPALIRTGAQKNEVNRAGLKR